MKKWAKTIALICFSLCTLELAAAYELPLNPEKIVPGGYISPDFTTQPPSITFLSNTTEFNSSNVNLPIQVKVGDSTTAKSRYLDLITCNLDSQNQTDIYRNLPGFMNGSRPITTVIESYATIINFTGLPDGNHTLTVKAGEIGGYIHYKKNVYYAYSFMINETVSIDFTIDTTSPVLQVSIENKTYSSANLPLTVMANEEVTNISCTLDTNVASASILNNSVLEGLEAGNHRLIIQVTDKSGNTISKTIDFTIIEPFPLLAAVLITGLICAVVLFLVIKRKSIARLLK